ncbi:CaiB/BaiF CoA transferase family protein [Kurthia sibirica]|uniref:Carnitine dehydratase n=1 Tax=Kurthia sibirica TaxID=202750 RepID=A0A2U3APG1_9BACL|nr:CaiB/BaiF CoA-transferase family protein [Kurthia sibirica]PWI26399.1 carnitine dehydratase [Kurthia sibirica]GEK34164.1 CoA transferase [Kurthia sibirica]
MLKDIKIIDFTSLLPGPFSTMLLADLGADVLHIVRPNSVVAWGTNEYLLRSKKVIEVDLKDSTVIEQLYELIKGADVVIEQFRPGVMARLQLGYEQLKKYNEHIIYCSITGYGQNGPYRDRAGHDINYVSLAGLASQSGSVMEGPLNNGTQIADIGGGSMYSAVAILAAYIHRQKTGEGQYIDVSMTDTSLTYNALTIQNYLMKAQIPQREEELLNGGTFYGFYQTKDRRYFSVGSLEPAFRQSLCEALGMSSAIPLSMSMKKEDIYSFKKLLQAAFSAHNYAELLTIFSRYDACVEPVLSLDEVFKHPQIIARNMIVDVKDTIGNQSKQLRQPIVFSNYTTVYSQMVRLNSLTDY